MERKKLLILGGGFAALQVAKRVSLDLYDVSMVSPRDHFLFTPLLASSTVGTTELRSITEPLLGFRRGVTYICAEAMSVDPIQRVVSVREVSNNSEFVFDLTYDVLVISVGSRIQTFGIPGSDSVACPLKETTDARIIRGRVVQQVKKALMPHVSGEERKRLLSFVVVGGGPTGIEFAGELSDLTRREFRRISKDLANDTSITVVDAGEHILSAFNQALRDYTLKILHRQKITVRTGTLVKEVKSDAVVLKSGEEIPSGLTIWSAGVTTQPFVQSSPFALTDKGRIVVNERLQVANYENVFALGDCASVIGKDYPTTAQVAQQQGKYLGKALNKWAEGATPKPFWYLHQGMLAYIGSSKGLAETPGGGGLRGRVAWLMWRSVYLTKLVSLRNKVLVLFDWLKARLFGRDLSQF